MLVWLLFDWLEVLLIIYMKKENKFIGLIIFGINWYFDEVFYLFICWVKICLVYRLFEEVKYVGW